MKRVFDKLSAFSVQRSRRPLPTSCFAFTLFELLASMGILAVLSALLFAAFNQATKAWVQGESRVETFTQARAALDFMTRELSQAITTTNIPFMANQNNLAFVATVGNESADGMDLMEVVYRLSKPNAAGVAEPALPGTPPRPGVFTDFAPGPYRLVRRISPFSALPAACRNYGIAGYPDNTATPWDFYTAPATWMETSWRDGTQVLATNVISLTFQFQDVAGNQPVDSATKPYWNSTSSVAWQKELGVTGVNPANASYQMLNRAPALVIITLTMLDSRAAARYRVAPTAAARTQIANESARQFMTSVAIPNRQP